MPSRNSDEFELLRRSSTDSFDLDDADPSAHALPHPHRSGLTSWLTTLGPFPRRRTVTAYSTSRSCVRRRVIRHVYHLGFFMLGMAVILVILAAIVNPSYSNPPAHYQDLHKLITLTGQANPKNEKIFIAANIIDADLIRGTWGKAVLSLIDLLGEKNVFLSVYENDSGPETTEALTDFEKQVKCISTRAFKEWR